MKKLLAITLVLCACVCITSCKENKATVMELSFDYQKQQTHGSNQYAIWIENAQKEVVKTLFVTSFTTKGRVRDGQPSPRGFVFRPACVPTWVEHSGAADMSDEELDAFTGATPSDSGVQTFVWDFTDQQGEKVASGDYKVFLEATLFDNTRIIYSGDISTRETGEVEMVSIKSGSDERFDSMISEVKLVVK